MELQPSPEQQALTDAVRRFCDEQITPARLAAWDKESGGVDDTCWRAAADLGWLGLGLPSSAGGSGLGLVEVACVLAECARGLVPRCIINAIRGGMLLSALAPDSEHLAAVARGDARVTWALAERHGCTAAAWRTRLSSKTQPPRVSGEKWYVPDAAGADLHVVGARNARGVALVLVAGATATTSALRTFDGERQAVVRYDDAPVVQRLTKGGAGESALAAVQRQQTALALAEMVGGMDAVLTATVAYVKEREQFGQKLAVFQAVQHQVADMATAYTAGRHLAWQAITRLAAGTEAGGELETAAAFVGQAFKRLTLAAHHLHGGAGYVVEHPLHYHAERAQALCIRYTPEVSALEAVASGLLDAR